MLGTMRFWILSIMIVIVAGCTAEVEDRGRAPDVDIDAGEMPEIDVDPADVRISTDTQVIQTPDIDVVPREP